MPTPNLSCGEWKGEHTPAREQLLAERLAAWEAFKEDFVTRSKKGNLWLRICQRKTVSVFKRKDALYGWSIASYIDGVKYSQEGFHTEHEAVRDLWWALRGILWS